MLNGSSQYFGERQPAGRKGSLIPILVLIAVCFAAYGNTLLNGFVYDDAGQVLGNKWITGAQYLPQIFSSSVWKFEGIQSNYYRPLMYVVYLICYFLFGLQPWGYHLVNVAFHAASCVVIFLISRKLFSRSQTAPVAAWGPAFAVALLFTLHPIHTEAVAWIAGIPELGFTLFSLIALYAHITRGEKKTFPGTAVAALSFALALLFKETALVLPGVLIAYDFAFKENRDRPVRARSYVPLLAVAAVYIMVRISVLGGFAPVQRHGDLSAYHYFLNVLSLFGGYLAKLVWPAGLNAYHVFRPVTSLWVPEAALALIAALLFTASVWIAMKRDKTAFFGLLLVVIPLLPVLYVSGVGENTFAERYLYLPSFGFSLFAVTTAGRAGRRPFPVLAAALAAVLIWYAFATVQRNAVWRSDLSLWSDAAAKSPGSVVAREAKGYALLNAGRTDEAIACLEEVLRDKPDFLEAHQNIGLAYRNKNRDREAIAHFQAALAIRPDYVNARRELASVYRKDGLTGEAIEQYRAIAALDPDSSRAHTDLAIALGEAGKTDEAIEQFLQALRLNPGDPDTRFNLGIAYEEKGIIEKAAEQFGAASRLSPSDPEIAFRKDRIERAIAERAKRAGFLRRAGQPNVR